jgi:hypothetical protein
MHINAPLCTGTNAGHEISCFVVIINLRLEDKTLRCFGVSSPTPHQHHGCDCCEWEVFHLFLNGLKLRYENSGFRYKYPNQKCGIAEALSLAGANRQDLRAESPWSG